MEEVPETGKVEMIFPVEETTYTLEGGKIKKGVSTGEIKESSEVEGAAEPTPYLLEQWKAGKGGFDAIYSFLGKPLPEQPAEDAAAAPAEEAPAAAE